MLGCELDKELYDFMKDNAEQNKADFLELKKFSFITKDELFDLGPILLKPDAVLQSGFALPSPGTFKRIVRIDFSAAALLNNDIYNKVTQNVTNALMTFWANRVTLVKFGRKYCTNFFKNLAFSKDTVPIENFFGSFEKPVLVFGAGESTQQGIEKIKKTGRDNYKILCADTALQPLISNGINPDGVFIEEAQNVISKCFIGTQKSDIHIFAGLSSLHSITRYFKPEQISFFTTEFVQAKFIERFEKAGILPPKNQPFGSVGITTYYYATLFRKDESVPIETYGLDFSYSAGRTHTKGAMADNARFMTSSRIKNDANYGAAFNEPAFRKNENMYTTPIMQRYDAIMSALRQAQGPQNKLQGPQNKLQEPKGMQNSAVPESVEGPEKITLALQHESETLQTLKSLLTGEKTLPEDKLKKEITQLITEREYLYLHFPDGQKFVYTQSFLNRVRIEVDYFLKVIR